jgi:hypothetical protein
MKKFTNSTNLVRGKVFPLWVAGANVLEHYRVSGVLVKIKEGGANIKCPVLR